MKKRNFIILGVVMICAVIFLGVYYSVNIPIAQNIDHLEINHIVSYSDNGDSILHTESSNIDAIKEILVQSQCKLHTTSFAPYPLSKVVYELNGMYNGRPMHILVGDLNIVYEDSSHGGHQIVHAEELLARISQCIK